MVAPIKQTVVVQPGGVVEIRSDQLRPGTRVEVTVQQEEAELREDRIARRRANRIMLDPALARSIASSPEFHPDE